MEHKCDKWGKRRENASIRRENASIPDKKDDKDEGYNIVVEEILKMIVADLE